MTVTNDAPAVVPTRPRTGWFAAGGLLCLIVAHAFSASASRCAGVVENGQVFDSAGSATSSPPECIAITMGPNAFVVWAIIIGALVVAFRARWDRDAARAQALLDRTLITIAVVTVVSVGLAMLWWSSIDIMAWEPGKPVPFATWPFIGSVDVQISPAEIVRG